MNQNLHFTVHARQRMQLRALSEQDVLYVIRHGTRIWSGGMLHYFLRRKDIPGQDQRVDRIRRLEGTTVLVRRGKEGLIVITAYRNRKACRAIRRKGKTNFKKWGRMAN